MNQEPINIDQIKKILSDIPTLDMTDATIPKRPATHSDTHAYGVGDID